MISENLIILETVDSTNNYAMGMVQSGNAKNGDAVFALEQTAGKGRRASKWESPRGVNILLTLIAEMQWLPVLCQFQLSAAVSVGCYDFLSGYIEKNLKIKWPNDIFLNDRKAGGILIENVIKGNLWQWAIIGIGINVNQEEFETKLPAISMKQVTGQTYNVPGLAGELRLAVLNRVSQLKSGNYTEILNDYNRNLFAANKKVKLKKGPIIFETTVQKVTAGGKLVTNDVMERNFDFDEVKWLL